MFSMVAPTKHKSLNKNLNSFDKNYSTSMTWPKFPSSKTSNEMSDNRGIDHIEIEIMIQTGVSIEVDKMCLGFKMSRMLRNCCK